MLKIAFVLAMLFSLAACATQDQVYRYAPERGSARVCQTGGLGCG